MRRTSEGYLMTCSVQSTHNNRLQVVCGKEHCMLLTEHGQLFSWGGGSRGQLGHGTVTGELEPRLVLALDGLRIIKIAAGGWHSAAISESHDLYMFGWNESGQLAQQTNLARPAECFSWTVEKLLMACCTGAIAEGNVLPRGDTEVEWSPPVQSVLPSHPPPRTRRSTGSSETRRQTRGRPPCQSRRKRA